MLIRVKELKIATDNDSLLVDAGHVYAVVWKWGTYNIVECKSSLEAILIPNSYYGSREQGNVKIRKQLRDSLNLGFFLHVSCLNLRRTFISGVQSNDVVGIAPSIPIPPSEHSGRNILRRSRFPL